MRPCCCWGRHKVDGVIKSTHLNMVSSTGEAGEAESGPPWPSPSYISGIGAIDVVSPTSPVTAQAPRQTPRHGGSATAFDVQLRQQVSRARLNQQQSKRD